MRPPSAWIERLTTSMPTPRPEMLEIDCAVEKPGMNSRLSISPSVSWASGAINPFLIDLLAWNIGRPLSLSTQV